MHPETCTAILEGISQANQVGNQNHPAYMPSHSCLFVELRGSVQWLESLIQDLAFYECHRGFSSGGLMGDGKGKEASVTLFGPGESCKQTRPLE